MVGVCSAEGGAAQAFSPPFTCRGGVASISRETSRAFFADVRLFIAHPLFVSCVCLPPLRCLSFFVWTQVWAIGTGLTATPADAQGIHKYVRSLLKEKYGDTVADGVRIQYGERILRFFEALCLDFSLVDCVPF